MNFCDTTSSRIEIANWPVLCDWLGTNGYEESCGVWDMARLPGKRELDELGAERQAE